MSPNISLGICPLSIAVEVASFFDKSYNFSEKAFIKYFATAPTSHVKLCFGKHGFIPKHPSCINKKLDVSLFRYHQFQRKMITYCELYLRYCNPH